MTRIDDTLLDQLSTAAAASPRLRSHHNIHSSLEDPFQRLAVASEPGTYIRPHRHSTPGKWELMTILRGSAVVLLFADDGCLLDRAELSDSGPARSVEIPADAWHGFATTSPRTAILEIKKGPYARPPPEDFAAWAPDEGDAASAEFERWFIKAKPGDKPPPLSK